MNNRPHHLKECLRMFEKLSEYIDSELDELTCNDIEKHMKTCIQCKICLETLKRTVALCKNTEDEAVPNLFSRRLKAFVQDLSSEQ